MRESIYSYPLKLKRKIKEKKNEQSNRRKQIDSYDKENYVRIQFILEIHVYGQN